ncbi:MAG: DUF7931 domain-containing protein, partial [bacterium]
GYGTKRYAVMHNDFIVVDETRILYKQEGDRYIGYSVDYAPREAKEISADFDELWEQSEPDPEVRRLYL